MARSQATAIENNFSRGLITEATALNYPENACIDCDNVRFNKKGEVYRRLGMDKEADAATVTKTVNTGAVVEYVWKGAGDNEDFTFLAMQSGTKVYFFSVEDGNNVSDGEKTFEINLETYKASGAPTTSERRCSFTEGNGFLFIAHPYCDPIYVEYDDTGDSITVAQTVIQVRDFEGVEPTKVGGGTLEVDERPSPSVNGATANHFYNLLNQGWWVGDPDVDPAAAPTDPADHTDVPLDNFRNQMNALPSNADIQFLGVNANNAYEWDDRNQKNHYPPTAEAPKGHFILDVFDKDRATASGVTGIAGEDSEHQRPSVTAFFAGRLWYAGVNFKGYSKEIYYTQTLKQDTEDFAKCYQNNDPTDEDFNDILATDGGVITIYDMGDVVGLVPSGNSLVVLTTKGVWSISGGESDSFKATDFTIRKVSSVVCISDLSVVDVEGRPVWWSLDGIYTLQPNQLQTSFDVVSVSEDTIKTFFDDIPSNNKIYAKGAYNVLEKEVVWVYRETEPTVTADIYKYDKALVLDTQTGAFSPFSFSDGVDIQGVFTVDSKFVSGGSVFDVEYESTVTKYIGLRSSVFYFIEERDTTYLDYDSFSLDEDYTSYLETGYKVRNEGHKEFQFENLTVYTKTPDTGTPSCLMEVRWDYATDDSTGDITDQQEVCRNSPNRDYHFRKLAIRGRGRAATFRFDSVEGKPFILVGWVEGVSGDAN